MVIPFGENIRTQGFHRCQTGTLRCPGNTGNAKESQRPIRCICLDARAGAEVQVHKGGSQVHLQVSPVPLCSDTWDLPALVSWVPQVVFSGASGVRGLYSPPVPSSCLLWGHSGTPARWATLCVSGCLSCTSPPAPPLTSSAPSPRRLIVMPTNMYAWLCSQSRWELIVMRPSATITLVIGRWVRPLGANSAPALRWSLSPSLSQATISPICNNICTFHLKGSICCTFRKTPGQIILNLFINFMQAMVQKIFSNWVKILQTSSVSWQRLRPDCLESCIWRLARAVSKAYGGNSQLICLTPTRLWQCLRKKCINDRKSGRKTWELKDCFSSPSNDPAHASQIWNHLLATG